MCADGARAFVEKRAPMRRPAARVASDPASQVRAPRSAFICNFILACACHRHACIGLCVSHYADRAHERA
eukprot:1971988-Pyramimonas_sp.AAC.1